MNTLVLQSGGTSPVINASLAGLISGISNSRCPSKLFTSRNGIFGLIQDDLRQLEPNSGLINRLVNEPGSAFSGTSRVGRITSEHINIIETILQLHDISSVVNIGGNGTLQQTKSLNEALGDKINFCYCPKTVDNDLGDPELFTVGFTPGFPSCVNWWVHRLQDLNLENLGAYTHDNALVVQTFGRETGFIAATAYALCDEDIPIYITLPESKKTLEEVTSEVEEFIAENGRAIVLISEGQFSDGLDSSPDKVGQQQYGSTASTSAQLLTVSLINNHITARSIIPGPMQRVFRHEVLDFDRKVAFILGRLSADLLLKGEPSFMTSVLRDSEENYHFDSISLDTVPNPFSRSMHSQFIDGGKPSPLYTQYAKGLANVRTAIDSHPSFS